VIRELRSGIIAAVVAASGWIALALRSPSNTYHFAPLVVALAVPVASRSVSREQLGRWTKVFIGSAGGLAAALIGLWLAWTGNLEGPALWGGSGALVEVLVFSLGGALVGNALVWRS
jgi:hypothetical protein